MWRTSAPSARPVGITSIVPAAAGPRDVVVTVNVIAASSVRLTCREHSTRRLRGNRSIVDGAGSDVSPFTLHPSPFTLHPSHCGLRAAAVPPLAIRVAGVGEKPQSPAQEENR